MPFRTCIVPRWGKVLVSADYSFLELTTLAQWCVSNFGYSRLAEVINQGQDPHVALAAFMAGMSYEEATKARKDPTNPHHKLIKQLRQNAKVVNFGAPGGLGANTLVDYARSTFGVQLTPDQAYELIQHWKGMYPEMQDFLGSISVACSTSSSGRFTLKQLGSNRLRGGCSYTAGANSTFQGLAADGAKAAMWELWKDTLPGGALEGVALLLFIHDEFIVEGAEDTLNTWAGVVEETMRSSMQRYTPDVIQPRPDAVAMRRWYKGAEPVKVGGRLVCSKPETRIIDNKPVTFWVPDLEGPC